MVSTVIPEDRAGAVPEVAVYLKEAVGNSTRIDYGTGNSPFVLRCLGSEVDSKIFNMVTKIKHTICRQYDKVSSRLIS